MSKVLVAYASRTGSTREIAEAISDELRQTDHTVILTPCADAADVDGFDAVVIGSALHGRRWMPAAVGYLHRQGRYLINRPTFLFQSGPCGEDLPGVTSTPVPGAVRRVIRRFDLPEPVTFPGRLDPGRVRGRIARWLTQSGAPRDCRDWTAIRAWGYEVGIELHECLARRPQRPHDFYHPLSVSAC